MALLVDMQAMEAAHLGGESTEGELATEEMDESCDPLEESGATVSEDEDEDIDDAVLEDMERFQKSFRNISQRYRLVNRIGEGTFSTVYKAEDLLYDHYENDWDLDADKDDAPNGVCTRKEFSIRSRKPKYVALKKIYVTSSPSRIMNELELLHDLRAAENVAPLITAFRHQDQVIAVLPYFQHKDFREYYRDFSIGEVRIYLHNLFTALKHVHAVDIIHRDIKPTNFLYLPKEQRGVLVDFGLAERDGTDFYPCMCCYGRDERKRRVDSSVYASTIAATNASGQPLPRPSYPRDDQRSSRRANRAGTRGFRAPEVLLKCTAQTPKIDVWSCGIILLTFLSQRFPFFHSADDIDAFIEMCTIFGKKKMKETALLHGQVLQTNVPTIFEGGHGWEKVLLWCLSRNKKDDGGGLTAEECEAVEFMKCCLELDPKKRISAADALKHKFLAKCRPVVPADDNMID